MRFLVASNVLLKQLSAINGVVASNPILPILENILVELEGNQLTLTASDLQTVMTTTLEVEGSENGSIALPAKLLLETLRSLPDQPVTLSADQATFGSEISTSNGRFKLSGENPIDFPKIPEVTKNQSIDVSALVLGEAIANTLLAVSNDDMRPAMTGVLIQMNPEHTNFVATDGHRLVRYRRTDIQTEQSSSLILPKKALALLKATLPSDDSQVKVEFSASNAFFNFQSIQLICRIIDERFPEYENAIPKQNENIITINRLELLSSVKRISIYSNKTTHQIRLKVTGNKLSVSAEDLDYSNEANEALTCEYKGTDMEIGFNAKLISELLSNLGSKFVDIKLSEPNKAGLIIPSDQDDNEDILLLVMPVMLNSYN
ncbi:DNA polymerase III subunit beta [Sandaracinomonas limnophila]|jgi:DNA polymerase-3 subunit beta|uniref:Beta sliding clamp n=1 Tax=Sandaracinomonas limnophila TaxID=1862386 RepID=A0A437PMD0_9BACT|nr:DNA polymerase III subunit beta [Sandaracinomonas limnophila]RVU23442.1 DNA polymerase III subunit beta [Sandaracinomonas limnophila]